MTLTGPYVFPISEVFIKDAGISLNMFRLDLLHPITGGNKIFKLKYNLEKAIRGSHDHIITFGGAYSNHIAATALACHNAGIKCTGIIRGEEVTNHVLEFARDHRMNLKFISRVEYRNKRIDEFLKKLEKEFGNFYLIPEGGNNFEGVLGCREIQILIPEKVDCVCLPVGTGATMAGILLGNVSQYKMIGFSALRSGGQKENIINYLKNSEVKVHPEWQLNESFHFGGYAKKTVELENFIRTFQLKHKIPLDFVYNGKMMFGIFDMMSKGLFKKGTNILAIHTGGIFSAPC